MGKTLDKDLSKMHWRERYEYEARGQAEVYRTYDEDALISCIERGLIDSYFAIWRAIGQKGSIEKSAMVLWNYLKRSPGKRNMLNRYHCAAALFNILGKPDPASEDSLRKRVQWDHEGEEARQQALLELKALIENLLGSGASR